MAITSAREAREAALRECFLFADLDREILEKIARVTLPVRFQRNQQLFEQGEEANGLYIVQNGLVRIWISSEDGRELTINLIEPGDALGEIALLDGLPRTANATALEPSEMLFLSRPEFVRLLDADPLLSRHIVELLCERLRRNTEDLSNFAFFDLRQRLAAKLLELAIAHATISEGGATFHRRFSQTALAQMLAASREAVNKALSGLSQRGLVTVDGGTITIPDMERLRQVLQAPADER
ncbi:Crp/Fnr family transcriptional regulator [Stappia sediminis]|nr:Crp/Fnr family transcriptional regulator [Stappia sediminis]